MIQHKKSVGCVLRRKNKFSTAADGQQSTRQQRKEGGDSYTAVEGHTAGRDSISHPTRANRSTGAHQQHGQVSANRGLAIEGGYHFRHTAHTVRSHQSTGVSVLCAERERRTHLTGSEDEAERPRGARLTLLDMTIETEQKE